MIILQKVILYTPALYQKQAPFTPTYRFPFVRHPCVARSQILECKSDWLSFQCSLFKVPQGSEVPRNSPVKPIWSSFPWHMPNPFKPSSLLSKFHCRRPLVPLFVKYPHFPPSVHLEIKRHFHFRWFCSTHS